MKTFFVFALLLLLSGYSSAQTEHTISVQQAQKMQHIGQQTQILEDPAGRLTIQHLLNDSCQQQFSPLNQEVFNHPTTTSTFWFKFTIKNSSDKEIWLKTGNTFSFDSLDLYALDSLDTPISYGHSGVLRPRSNQQFHSNYFCFFLANAKETTPKTFYLKVKGRFFLSLNLMIGSSKALHNYKILEITFSLM